MARDIRQPRCKAKKDMGQHPSSGYFDDNRSLLRSREKARSWGNFEIIDAR